jgi:SAM-dependent methyltransferase
MSFGAVAARYDRLRPGIPAEAVDWLLPAAAEVVVDLGAGTGLLARAVVPKAGHVIAVEPDERMRAVLRERCPGVEVLAGRGEQIPLPEASADAVLVASAWHWMDPELAAAEITRILRDGGRFGVIWTSWDRSTTWLRSEEWFERPDDGDRPDGSRGGSRDRSAAREWLGRQVEVSGSGSGSFENIETQTFQFNRMMSIPDIADMLTTYSRVITASDEVKAAGRARALAALAEQFPDGGEIEVRMLCRCWRADRARRSATLSGT